MKFAENIHPTRLFGPTFFYEICSKHPPYSFFGPTRLIGTWEYCQRPSVKESTNQSFDKEIGSDNKHLIMFDPRYESQLLSNLELTFFWAKIDILFNMLHWAPLVSSYF